MPIRVENFIEATHAAASTDQLLGCFSGYVAESYGAEIISYRIVARHFKKTPIQSGLRLAQSLENWYENCASKGYSETNPVVERCLKTSYPFRVIDAFQNDAMNDSQRAFLHDIYEWGFDDGIVLPIYDRPGTIGMVGISSRVEKIDLPETEIQSLHAITRQLHSRYENLIEKEDSKNLTPREAEVLSWIIRGKSNASIATILGISVNTVDTLVRRCFGRLKVSNRVEAAIKGVGLGVALR